MVATLVDVGLEPLLELLKRLAPVRDLVLLCLWHLCVCLALVFKGRVPAEVGRASRRHDLAIGPALEEDRLVARALGVPEGADGLGGLVLEAVEHLVQVLDADGLHEPFDVWSREVVHGLEAEAGILHQDGATNMLGSPPALVQRHLLHSALDLNQIHALVTQLDAAVSQDGLDFGKLVGVAGDEVELLGCHFGCLFRGSWIAVERRRVDWEKSRTL